jgi:hypothetical protein
MPAHHDCRPATPAPGSKEELSAFAALQASFVDQYQRIFADRLAPRTIVVNPSLSMDHEVLKRIEGVQHYEERMLCLLMLLRMPRTRLVFLSSLPIHPSIVEYYLNLLPGIPSSHAHNRLRFLACHDASPRGLSEKVLERPRLVERIRGEIETGSDSHMSCFVVTEKERSLAVALGLPIYGCDPALGRWGTKSGSREIFREMGVPLPDGFENLRDSEDVFGAVTELKNRNPDLRRATIKLEEGTSGEGNAVFDYQELEAGSGLAAAVRRELPERLRCEAPGLEWEGFAELYDGMGGIVESWVDGAVKASPSMQGRIRPTGEVEALSTHDQELGGPTGQMFLGSTFPAHSDYRLEIQEMGLRVGEGLSRRGGMGRYAVDFISTRGDSGWKHFAIEINIRKGGTTHPFLMLQFLTDGRYDPETGQFLTPAGRACCYYATDNLKQSKYRGLLPEDLIDIAACNDLHFHGASQTGVVFHLIGALSEFGKLGVLCIDEEIEQAKRLYQETVSTLDLEMAKET